MSELEKILLTSFSTVIGGVMVYVLGQIFMKFVIDPIHEQSKLIGEIADSLIFYANVYANPGVMKDKETEVARIFRQQSTQLLSKTHLIPWYKILNIIHIVLSELNISEASKYLILLSNSIQVPPSASISERASRNLNAVEKIKEMLHISF